MIHLLIFQLEEIYKQANACDFLETNAANVNEIIKSLNTENATGFDGTPSKF